jgi:hypothetical protein
MVGGLLFIRKVLYIDGLVSRFAQKITPPPPCQLQIGPETRVSLRAGLITYICCRVGNLPGRGGFASVPPGGEPSKALWV